MPRKKTTTPKKATKETKNTAGSPTSIFDYLRFGESYTSLLLGIVVVIISTLLLLSFIHNKNTGTSAGPKDTSSSQTNMLTKIPSPSNLAKSIGVSGSQIQETVTPTPNPTRQPTQVVKKTSTIKGDIYTVTPDDTLWKIAEKTYKSGYNWVDIAKANNLANPSDIHKGDRLVLPSVAPKIATVSPVPQQAMLAKNTQAKTQAMVATDKITGSTYTITTGDTLWSIAVRAYGDGYKWVDIAKANNLTNPGLIHSQNILKIPRG